MRRMLLIRIWAVSVAGVALATLAAAAPGSALVAHWYNDTTDYFSGAGCGDTSQVALPVPGNAYAISVVKPLAGTTFNDDVTGSPIATITSVRRTPGAIMFTATGSDDTCANPDAYVDFGWETDNVYFRVNYSTKVHVLYPSACTNPGYRVRRIIIACGDGNFYVGRIHWSWWNDGNARGVGTGHMNDCVPYCAAGHFHAYADVAIRLYRRRYCAANGDYDFTRLQYRFGGPSPAGILRGGSGLNGCAI